MSIMWTDIGERTWLLTRDGVREAVVSFIGNHVERPDEYCVTLRRDDGTSYGPGFGTLREAKEYAEEETQSSSDPRGSK